MCRRALDYRLLDKLYYTPETFPQLELIADFWPSVSLLSATLVYCGQTAGGWMDQDATWYGDKPRPRPHCVRWGPSSSTERSQLTVVTARAMLALQALY